MIVSNHTTPPGVCKLIISTINVATLSLLACTTATSAAQLHHHVVCIFMPAASSCHSISVEVSYTNDNQSIRHHVLHGDNDIGLLTM